MDLQDVILASGCSHALDLCICVLAKPGQHILIPRPGFPLYKTLTSVYGVHFRQYNLLADQNWAIDLDHLESLIDHNTAAIVVNNPSNPCGSVFSAKHLIKLLELADKHKKPIIADEIYDKFVFPRQVYQRHPLKDLLSSASKQRLKNGNQQMCAKQLNSALNNDNNRKQSSRLQLKSSTLSDATDAENGDELDDLLEPGTFFAPFVALSSLSKSVPILTCGGISKTCLIPGLRLGWIIVNDPQGNFHESVRSGLNRLTQRLMGPSSLVQGALGEILTKVPESFYSQTMEFIYKNAHLCHQRLSQVRGLQPHMPQGSMYMMVRFEPSLFPSIQGDLNFTSRLMNEESVLVLPGKCFDFPNYFRLCLTVPTKVMDEALDRLIEFCARHYSDCEQTRTTTTTTTKCITNSNDCTQLSSITSLANGTKC